MEEITPAQLALFPESVRHLRKKQGAMCWWKHTKSKQRWKTCLSNREDEEKGGQNAKLSPSLSPSCRFWKEMRYQMPVKGKRAVYPEKTALLNVWSIRYVSATENENRCRLQMYIYCLNLLTPLSQKRVNHTLQSQITSRPCFVNFTGTFSFSLQHFKYLTAIMSVTNRLATVTGVL